MEVAKGLASNSAKFCTSGKTPSYSLSKTTMAKSSVGSTYVVTSRLKTDNHSTKIMDNNYRPPIFPRNISQRDINVQSGIMNQAVTSSCLLLFCVCINYTVCIHHELFVHCDTLFLFKTIVARSELLAMHVDYGVHDF